MTHRPGHPLTHSNDAVLHDRRKVLLTLLAAPVAVARATVPSEATPSAETDAPPPTVDRPSTDADHIRALVDQVLPNVLLPGDVIQRTRFAGVWSIRNTRQPALPRYVDDNAQWFINIPRPIGLQGTRSAVSPQAVIARRRAMAQQIDVSQWVLMQNSTKPVALIFSAYDCPYCAQMESELTRAGFSYYLMPRGVTLESSLQARRAYASTDPAAAWRDLLAQGRTNAQAAAGRSYPDADAADTAFLFMSQPGSVPGVPLTIFADGGTIGGWDTATSMPKVQARVTQKVFFRAMEKA